MDIKTYDQNAKEVFEKFRLGCSCRTEDVCEYTDKLCTLNSCCIFKSRYLDFTPICRIPGRQCCTVAMNEKDWKQGDCCTCKIAEKFENPE